MSGPRRSRLLAGAGGAAVAVLGGALLVPHGASAAALSRPAAALSRPAAALSRPAAALSVGVPAAAHVAAGAPAWSSTTAAGSARAARTSRAYVPSAPRALSSRLVTRLTVTARPGPTVAVVGVLSRYSTAARIPRRFVKVYLRTADTGAWQRAATLRTSLRGRVEFDVRNRPRLQVTLRFAGDPWFGPAASPAVVPEPTGARGLSPSLVRALGTARTAAGRVGLRIVVNSGFRSWAQQQQMYDAAVRRYGSARAARRWVLPPQESTHVRGLAVDLGTPAAAAWLDVRGARFGLCRAYGDEPWHFEYRPDWIAAFGGRCPAPVTTPGDPDPLSPAPHVPVR